jgi:lipid-A-disaccharide synthase
LDSGKKKIMIVAGEASGDLHGSGVIKAVRGLDPGIRVYAMGSEQMRRAGAEILIDSSRLAVVGIAELWGRMAGLLKAYWNLKKFIKKNRPDLLILIDFPDFNLSLAGVARRTGVPVLYYISPQVWAWRSGRVKKIAGRVDKMAVIFPFEVSIYQKAGLDAEFVGHPLLDVLAFPAARGSLSLDHAESGGELVIGLLPGSREREIKSLLPEMVRAAEIIAREKPGTRFILPAAPAVDVKELEKFFHPHPVSISVVEGPAHKAITAAAMVIVASGTATLEAAILEKPMVIVYQVSLLSYWIGKAMVKVDWVGLVNIVAEKKVVPELLQEEARGERIAAEALRILNEETYRRGMVAELARVRKKLGQAGAAERVARMALEMIGQKEAFSDQRSAKNKAHG